MAYKIVYKAYAERDIWEIAAYLSEHSAAEKFLREVKDKIEKLTEMPFMYPKIAQYKDYRKIVAGNYVIVYLADEQAEEILIMRVVHGKRNYYPVNANDIKERT